MPWVVEALNRQHDLSIGKIRRLHSTLGISAGALIRPSRMATTKKRQIAR
jgi:antitoxin component HigA of HigAB toxin-antitoxin module